MTSSSNPTPEAKPAETDKAGASTPKTRRRRKRAIIILSSIFVFLGLIWFFYWLIWGRFEVYTDDAYINGNMVQLNPQIPGTVVAINTDDTQLVTKGQVIIKLDPSDMAIALQRAEAALANTVRKVRQFYENTQRAQQTLILRNADLMQAQLDFKRRIGLVGERAISREQMSHFQTRVETAQARYKNALYNLRSLLALVENSHLYSHPQVEHAKANLKQAYIDFQRTTIVAPVTGIVAKRTVQVGQQVNMRTPMLAIVPLNEVWVDANYKESQLSDIRMGQPATVYADIYSGVTFHGRIVGLNAGTGAAFSLLPPQNATGNWIKIVQRLPVRVSLEPEEIKKHPLLIGLSMRVTTDISDTSGSALGSVPKKTPVYSTNVFEKQLAEADVLINSILTENAPNIYLPRSQLSGMG